jgi:rubrerythrin
MQSGMAPYMAAPGQYVLTNLLIEAMKDELHDREKYSCMMEMAKEDKVKDQIKFAYEDEEKHYGMFNEILLLLTGKITDIPVPEVNLKDKLIHNVETSINGELEAVELYRKIKSLLPYMQMKDMLYEIITDEQEHATRFVYLYSLLSRHHDD